MKYRYHIAILLVAGLALSMSCSEKEEEFPRRKPGAKPASAPAAGTPDASGRLWRFRADGSIRSAIVTDGKYAYVGTDEGSLYAIDIEHGGAKWTFKAGRAVTAPPLVMKNMILAGDEDGRVHAIDINNGRSKWRFSAEDRISGISLFAASGQKETRLIVSSHDSNLYCLDAAGKQLWKLTTDDYINAAAAVSGKHVLIGGCDGHLRIVNAEDGKQVAAVDLEAPIPGSIIVADGDAYAATLSGRLCRLTIPEGKIVWSYQDKNEEFMAAPAVGKDYVAVGGSMGTLISVDRKTGRIPPFPVGPIKAEDMIECPVVPIGQDVVFGSNDGRIYLADPVARKLKWSYRIGREIIAGPAVAGDKFIVGSTDGGVYCFKRK